MASKIPDARREADKWIETLSTHNLDDRLVRVAHANSVSKFQRETILGLAAEAHRRGNPLVQFNDEADHTITLVQLRVSEWLEQEARKIK